MYGKLTTISGPMFSSKTSELLKRILWAKNGTFRDVHVFRIEFDDRYSTTEIVSHDGLKTTATSIREPVEIINTGNTIVFFDEVQFFYGENFNGDVIAWIKSMLEKGIEVVVAGLDMDWQGNPFPVVSALSSMANDHFKLKANCTVCGHPASKTYKVSQEGGSVELGTTREYEARCDNHWNTY
ncbi:thymidine kinase [Agrobacterium phage Atu_ph07]|uniref:Thymidine kinase n=1 Tax=Agrobacterium phage Atu_ph07 TaxID=2024264 RepID=A0A2L0V0Y3_9CAUD|nr:thymidine kinase [Agrobacterium phage Atu_ph07]AUZ95448.1 thymidine kinase [Agrobacterium phage Atu_ph07]